MREPWNTLNMTLRVACLLAIPILALWAVATTSRRLNAQPVEQGRPAVWAMGASKDAYVTAYAVDTPAKCIYIIVVSGRTRVARFVVDKDELPKGSGCQ